MITTSIIFSLLLIYFIGAFVVHGYMKAYASKNDLDEFNVPLVTAILWPTISIALIVYYMFKPLHRMGMKLFENKFNKNKQRIEIENNVRVNSNGIDKEFDKLFQDPLEEEFAKLEYEEEKKNANNHHKNMAKLLDGYIFKSKKYG